MNEIQSSDCTNRQILSNSERDTILLGLAENEPFKVAFLRDLQDPDRSAHYRGLQILHVNLEQVDAREREGVELPNVDLCR